MDGTNELKGLILALDENRRILGNSQYAFSQDSPARAVLDQFSSAISWLRPATFQRIRENFLSSIPWATHRREVNENTANYVWSLVYPLRVRCDETNYVARIAELRQQFICEVEAVEISKKPEILSWVKERGELAFQQEQEMLALYYRQKREREALE